MERPFILIHQMGKVASTAIAEALRAHPDMERWQVQNTHTLNSYNHAQKRWFFSRAGRTMPPELGTGDYLLREVLPTDRPIHIISPFRDPVARNISSFFHSLDYYLPGVDRSQPVPTATLLDAFYARMRHEACVKWYFDEILEPFGIDVYATPFDHARAHQTYRSDRADLIIFPFDLPDPRKAALIAEFLGIAPFTLHRTNEAADRADAALYKRFIAEARLDDTYLDWMYGSRFARHFFTPDQLAALRARWSGTHATTAAA